MLWVYIAIVVAVIAYPIYLWYVWSEKPRDIGENIFMSTMPPMLVGMCLVIFVIFMNLACIPFVDKVYVDAERADIRSIADSSETRGSFFLGSGTVDGEAVYYYYETIAPGTYQQRQVDAYKVTIVEKDGVIPYVQKTESRSSNSFISFIYNDSRKRDKYYFYVPQGSVISNFDLDTSAK